LVKKKRKKKRCKYIHIKKYLSINIFYHIFLSLNKDRLNFYVLKLFKNKKFINLIFNCLYNNNNILYYNIEKFKNIYTNTLFISINFIKFYLNFNYYKMLWLKLIGFKKRLLKKKKWKYF